MEFALFRCLILTTLCAFSDSLILKEEGVTRKKDTEKGQASKNIKDGKIMNLGEVEKQVILNIENHLKPQFNMNLGNGMLKNILCSNWNKTCKPEYTKPQYKPTTTKTMKRPPNTKTSSTMGYSFEETEIVSVSDDMGGSSDFLEIITKTERLKTTDILFTISSRHDSNESGSEESGEDERYMSSKKPRKPKPTRHFSKQVITEEYSAQTITDDSGETTEPYTKETSNRMITTTDTTIVFSMGDKNIKGQKPITRTKGTSTRPTRQPKPSRLIATEILTIGRETTRPTDGTTELIEELSVASFDYENMKPTIHRLITKPPEKFIVGLSVTYHESDESTTEMSPSRDSKKSNKSTELHESSELFLSNESETESSESQNEQEGPDYGDSEAYEEAKKLRKPTLKPSKKKTLITKLNCTDLFPPSGNRKH